MSGIEVSHNAGQQVPGMGRAASPRRLHSERWCSVEKMVIAGKAEVGLSPRKIAAEGSREREREREIFGRAVSVLEVQLEVGGTMGSGSETGVLRKTRVEKVEGVRSAGRLV